MFTCDVDHTVIFLSFWTDRFGQQCKPRLEQTLLSLQFRQDQHCLHNLLAAFGGFVL